MEKADKAAEGSKAILLSIQSARLKTRCIYVIFKPHNLKNGHFPFNRCKN